jgi:hypothetical protein
MDNSSDHSGVHPEGSGIDGIGRAFGAMLSRLSLGGSSGASYNLHPEVLEAAKAICK